MKILLLMAFLAVGMTANAETIVTSDDDTKASQGVELGKGKDANDRWSAHVQLGVNVPTDTPEGVDFAPFRSWELGVTLLQYDYTPKNWNTTFSAGLGFGWRAYTLKGHDKAFVKDSNFLTGANYVDVDVVPGSYYGHVDDLSSNVHITSLSMPLLVKQRFSKNFAISLGAQLNCNIWGRLHTSYELGDEDVDIYTKNLRYRPFTVDVLGIVHVWELGLYCKYSPMSVFKKDKGPEFKSFAFGIYF
jgi:hypothetical protein